MDLISGVLFDMEHSGFGFETVKQAVRYFDAADLPAIVRVPSKAYDHMARVADMGAEGVMVPMVDTADEARALVANIKYPPIGRRGVALGVAHDAYASTGSVADRLTAANERICLFAQIETESGVTNADAIAAVEGVDSLFIGRGDLTAAFGDETKDPPAVLRAVELIAEAGRKANKPISVYVGNATEAEWLGSRGATVFVLNSDQGFLRQAATSNLKDVRGKVSSAAA